MIIKESRKVVTLEDAETVLRDFGVDTSNMGVVDKFEKSIELVEQYKDYTFESKISQIDIDSLLERTFN